MVARLFFRGARKAILGFAIRMSFAWADYLDVADYLAASAGAGPSAESYYRSSISRAYYGVFCSARNLLRDEDRVRFPSPPARNIHTFVHDQYRRHLDKTRRKIGQDLNRLRLARNQADYDDSIGNIVSVSTTSIVRARNVLRLLNNL